MDKHGPLNKTNINERSLYNMYML